MFMPAAVPWRPLKSPAVSLDATIGLDLHMPRREPRCSACLERFSSRTLRRPCVSRRWPGGRSLIYVNAVTNWLLAVTHCYKLAPIFTCKQSARDIALFRCAPSSRIRELPCTAKPRIVGPRRGAFAHRSRWSGANAKGPFQGTSPSNRSRPAKRYSGKAIRPTKSSMSWRACCGSIKFCQTVDARSWASSILATFSACVSNTAISSPPRR